MIASDELDGNAIDIKAEDIPVACFQNDRNRLREFIISWLQLVAPKEFWYSHGMSYSEELWSHFYSMDVDKNKFLDSKEIGDYLDRNRTVRGHQSNSNEHRQLCLDALVEEGDNNYDWRLSFQEFKRILEEKFVPSAKLCTLDGILYEDGAETRVHCNGCVCACGKWICTSKKCSESNKTMLSEKQESASGDNDLEGNFDIEYENNYNSLQDSPEDDPDVQDINWF